MSLTSQPINEAEAAAEKAGADFFSHLAILVDHILDRVFSTRIVIEISEKK